MKNVINQAIGAFKFLATPNIKELKVTCMGMGHLTSVFEASLGKTIRDGCRTAFKTFDVGQLFFHLGVVSLLTTLLEHTRT